MERLTLELLPGSFAVCQLRDASAVDWGGAFCSLSRTDSELSLVCESSRAPANALKREDGWRMFRVCGPLDFSLTGILAKLSDSLARREIPLFALSTYDTDYVLVKSEHVEAACRALVADGCALLRPDAD